MGLLATLFKGKQEAGDSTAEPAGAPASPAPAASFHDDALIHLSVGAIARSLPPGLAAESLKALPKSVRVAFPFAWIEPQLSKGAVELPRDRFVEALPSEVRPEFNLAANASVLLPLEEILLNLPGEDIVEAPNPAPQPKPPKPGHPEPLPAPPQPTYAPEKSEAQAPVFEQAALQALFMTEDAVDLEKIARSIAALPGLEGCFAAAGTHTAAAGKIPAAFHGGELVFAAFRAASGSADTLGLGVLRSHTLDCGDTVATFLVRGGVCLCVFHTLRRGFLPGVREKLEVAAAGMSSTRF